VTAEIKPKWHGDGKTDTSYRLGATTSSGMLQRLGCIDQLLRRFDQLQPLFGQRDGLRAALDEAGPKILLQGADLA